VGDIRPTMIGGCGVEHVSTCVVRKGRTTAAVVVAMLAATLFVALPASGARAAGLLTVTTTSLPTATVGISYSEALTASGGTSPYTWAMTGALPAGLSLDSDGVISGTPTTRGAADLMVTVTDAASATASATLSIPVTSTAITELAGADRFGTAILVSQQEYPHNDSASAVVLARADSYPDALVGAALAAAKNAPLLFTSGTTLAAATVAEIQRLLLAGSTVYLLGGTSAIPASIAQQINTLGYVEVRYGGSDRYATAVAVAGALGNPFTVLLASGTNFPDALAASPAATKAFGAILLTDGSVVPPETSAYLATHHGTVYAVGGPAAAADPSAIPLVGADRYGTAIAVAHQFFSSPPTVGVASGATFADALAGGSLLAHTGGPLLLADPSVLPASTRSYLTTNAASLVTASIFGGPSALSAAVQTAVGVALGQ
jgi:putative cell wall-binding protein